MARQISQNYRSGRIRLETVNVPECRAGGVLVRTAYSVISAGTEGMKVREGRMSLLGKALARPDQVRKVLQTVRQQGPAAAFEKAMTKLDSLTPLGYSLSGTVIEVGPDAAEFHRGQRVACGGAEYAHHAEVVFVPKNLAVPVPDAVSLQDAAFATIGAIALHGFRRAEMQLGECACVVGLGLIGQILVRILRAAGVEVIGLDPAPERCSLAREAGVAVASGPDDDALAAATKALTGGHGVDCVFIAASGDSSRPIELAAELARDRARVIQVGKTGVDVPWNEYYRKELDLRFARSYGPGRYDRVYEEDGVDYPIGYVRWTERRNMAGFLDLLAKGRVRLAPLVSAIYPFGESERVYQTLAEGRLQGVGVLFEYPETVEMTRRLPALGPSGAVPAPGRARIGVIGAGNYASSMLLPHLARERRAELVEVATRTSLSAADAQRRFSFLRSSTDSAGLLGADDINAVVIVTRHSSHAALAAAALEAGHAVFVEKPLSIDLPGLERVREAIVRSGNDRLMVGFNRRFAPLLVELAAFFDRRSYPLVMSYRVHAGQLDRTSWYLQEGEGSRFAGEGGHFLDVFAFLTGSRPRAVSASCLRGTSPAADDGDNLCVAVTYEDGSLGTLAYLTQGGRRVPKEHLEVFGGGKAALLHNFTRLDLFEGDDMQSRRHRLDKGQKAEMAAFVQAMCEGAPMPIGVDTLIDTTLATLAAEESVRRGAGVELAEFWSAEAEATADGSP